MDIESEHFIIVGVISSGHLKLFERHDIAAKSFNLKAFNIQVLIEIHL